MKAGSTIRMRLIRAWVVVVLALGAGARVQASEAEAVVRPQPRAHAHNDYEHQRPLLDALAQGFGSVEADVHLVEGRLLVAHDRVDVRADRTLEALYLDPLKARVAANGGRVHAGAGEFFLLIDFKSEGEATWKVLRPMLGRYADMLTVYRPDATETKAATVIVSGNRPRALMESEAVRLAALDGRTADLEGTASRHLIPWISDSWSSQFQWRGREAMPPEEQARLRQWVQRAHAQGRKVRFWGAADVEAMWEEQWSAGVDLINTDRLEALRRFLEAKGMPTSAGQEAKPLR